LTHKPIKNGVENKTRNLIYNAIHLGKVGKRCSDWFLVGFVLVFWPDLRLTPDYSPDFGKDFCSGCQAINQTQQGHLGSPSMGLILLPLAPTNFAVFILRRAEN